jgi:hydrogenase nickel incorporation protein HypA/HybF
MHELGIAQALIEQVEEVRSRYEGREVISVAVRIGSWRLVVPESLDFYYTLLTRDTELAGSRLEIETVQARGRCSRCGETFPVEAPLIVCPACTALGGELVCGQELDLIGVELTD